MGKTGIWEIIVVLVLATAFLSILWLAIKKLVKSKISDHEKIVWIFALIAFNIISAMAFVLYHDYFLNSLKRAS
jgi:hypothetical protein